MNPVAQEIARPEYTRQLVEFLHGLEPQKLCAEVMERARYLLLDYLGVAIRGSQEESARAVQRMIRRTGAAGCATVFGTPIRVLPALAALANGTGSHSIEMDDTHNGGSIHLGTTMYSTALALAEALPGVPSDRFLTAVIAGYEAAARIAMALQPKEHYDLGFHPTGTCGAFGAAVTAAKLLGLNAEQTLAAVGIAGSMAAGNMEFLAEGAWTKRIHPGLAAQNGIQAAILATEGFAAPQHVLEGRDGFLQAHSRRPIAERLTENLGQSFEILHTAVKPHACCRYMQGPIDAILELMRRHSLHSTQIRKIEIGILEAGWGIVCEPRAKKYHPESVVDAQFSMPFGAAVTALYGSAGLEQFTEEKVRSPEVRQFMGKIVLEKDMRLEERFPEEWRAHAVIHLEDGSSHELWVRHPKGDPQNRLSWKELEQKFRSLAGAVLPGSRCDEIVARIRTTEPTDLAELCGKPIADSH